jgi:ribose transport system substrate-binding protein
MRYLPAIVAGSMLLFAGHASAADNQMTIAVFTKNRTNPAYEAFRASPPTRSRAPPA